MTSLKWENQPSGKGGLLLGHKQPRDEKRKVMGHEKSNRDDPL